MNKKEAFCCGENGFAVKMVGETLIITLDNSTTWVGLKSLFYREMRRVGVKAPIFWSNLYISLISAALVLMLSGVLAAFGNAFYALLLKYEAIQLAIASGSAIVFSLALYFVMSLNLPIATGDALKIGEWVRGILVSDKKLQKSFSRILVSIIKSKHIKKIEIYNPLYEEVGLVSYEKKERLCWFLEVIFPVLASDNVLSLVPVEVFARHDELYLLHSKIVESEQLNVQNKNKISINLKENLNIEDFIYWNGGVKNHKEWSDFLYSIKFTQPNFITKIEIELIPYLINSTYLDGPSGFLDENGGLQVFSEGYFINSVRQGMKMMSAEVLTAKATEFVVRCKLDYLYLLPVANDRWIVHPKLIEAEKRNRASNFYGSSFKRNERNFDSLEKRCDAEDSFSYIVAIEEVLKSNSSALSNHDNRAFIRNIANKYVSSISSVGQAAAYNSSVLMALDAQLNFSKLHVLKRCDFIDEETRFALIRKIEESSKFNWIDAAYFPHLSRLAELFAEYDTSLIFLKKIQGLNGFHDRVRSSRVLERKKGAQAINLHELVAQVDNYEKGILKGQSRDTIEIEFKAKIEAAWLIYSSSDSAYVAKGKEYLSYCSKVINLLGATDAEHLWRYYNYQGLYADWESNYSNSIEYHMEALSVPGVREKWYSGSLVNLGYTHRKYGIQKYSYGEKAEAHRYISESIIFLEQALSAKVSMEDKDELPVLYHNLAISYLCFYYICESCSATMLNSVLSSAIEYASSGIAILDEIGSDKKRVELYLEFFIIKHERYNLPTFDKKNDRGDDLVRAFESLSELIKVNNSNNYDRVKIACEMEINSAATYLKKNIFSLEILT